MTEEFRCECRTLKGTRCKARATMYRRHTDGREYLACKLHNNEFFRPTTGRMTHEEPQC
jgi:nitrite reductase/ring-hydroxylating ferredoxin subunit